MNPVNKILLIPFLILPLFAQDEPTNGKDHPLIPRYPGSSMIYYNKIPDASYNVIFGPMKRPSPDEDYRLTDIKRIRGSVTRIQYKTNEPDISKVAEYFESLLRENGFEISAFAKSDKPMNVAGRNWVIAAFKDLEYKDMSNITGTKTGIDNRYYIAGYLQRLSNKNHFTMVINEFDKNEIYIHVDIITSEFDPQRREILSAELIAQSIYEDGFATIYGIMFEMNSTDLSNESFPALDEVARYLNNNRGVNLYVVGHTSSYGKIDDLKEFSKRMAESVVTELITKYNIEPHRLIPKGVGPLSPVTTNSDSEGREINKRIEIVLKNF